MARPGDTDRDHGNGGFLGGITGTVKDRIIVALLAVIAGGGTSIGVVRTIPPDQQLVRPDAWTGTQARHQASELRRWVNERMRLVDEHLEHAEKGWTLIYEMREEIAVIKSILQRREREKEKD